MANIPIDIPPGLNSDDTTTASSAAWADGSYVRFRLGETPTVGCGIMVAKPSASAALATAGFAWTKKKDKLERTACAR